MGIQDVLPGRSQNDRSVEVAQNLLRVNVHVPVVPPLFRQLADFGQVRSKVADGARVVAREGVDNQLVHHQESVRVDLEFPHANEIFVQVGGD